MMGSRGTNETFGGYGAKYCGVSIGEFKVALNLSLSDCS
jgi:hypothetical protein